MTHQKCLEDQLHEASNLRTTRSHPLAMFTMHTTPAPRVPVRISSIDSVVSPECTHAITTTMGHPLSSESGNCIQKWIQYHAFQDPTDYWLYWDPTDPDDIKLLQENVESNGSVVYPPSSRVKSLISLWNYICLLIKRERAVDQKCNVYVFSKMINGSI